MERLSTGLRKRSQEVVFLVGAPLSAPTAPGKPGVPGVDGMIELIRSEFSGELAQIAALNQTLDAAGYRRYQDAFVFLQGRRGQPTVNEIVRNAVRAARNPGSIEPGTGLDGAPDEAGRLLDSDISGWTLSSGTEGLGKLVTAYPARFGQLILTTNFDPLIEVAIQRAGGQYFKTMLQSDGNLTQTTAIGCHVIHLHGYWYGSDTLHTPRQLTQARPRLRASLVSLLRNKLVVVCAYSGWDDAFTEAMMEVVRDDSAHPEIIWTFLSATPTLDDRLAQALEPGIDRGRVTLYAAIDCHRLFPRLCDTWSGLEAKAVARISMPSNPVRVKATILSQVQSQPITQTILEGDDEDRPPVVEICVGRDGELRRLEESDAKTVFLTGLGGQGKSTLAARYFAACQANYTYSFYAWRDCKEESERFENQLAFVIEKLSGGKVRGDDLAKQSANSIVQLLVNLIRDLRVLFVFDNVDHYVNLDTGEMIGSPLLFIEALVQSDSNSRAVFTCRPSVKYDHPLSLSRRLEGIELAAAVRLFEERGAKVSTNEVENAHGMAEGHAFWLDLLAIQVAKRPEINLTTLVEEIRSGGGLLPEKTLRSIWATLQDRERLVLRAMAETVKPDTEIEIGDYVRHKIDYNKTIKALKTLRSLNLIVVKQRASAKDVLELHPLVRQFIRQNFGADERISFIDAIIGVYKRFIRTHKLQLSERPTLSILQYWTQNAELDIAAGKMNDAFSTLAEASDAFLSSAYAREFCRVARLLFSKVGWVEEHAKFKMFENVFRAQAGVLSYLGEYEEADSLLEQYKKTVPNRDVRYINYCQMMCSSKWVRGDFNAAIEWGQIGQNLKHSSGVDTQYDLAHSLALAERDAGRPELALPVFLAGQQLSDVTDPEELDEERGGAYYGNIGRCLHFMGQVDPALICYQKSALLIEKDPSNEHVLNQGYIRAWIGELLVAREQFRLAEAFFRAAFFKWEHIYPLRASEIIKLSRQLKLRITESPQVEDLDVERTFTAWILGRNLDS